jgi:hypothetical protein
MQAVVRQVGHLRFLCVALKTTTQSSFCKGLS